MTRLVVTGASGRMGQTVIETAGDRSDCQVTVGVSRTPDAVAVDVPVEPAADLPAVLERHAPDAVVDFTAPEATVECAEACVETGVALVTGTTGLDADQTGRLEAAAAHVPLLWAPNFSRGVQALLQAIEAAVPATADYDAEVLETHHSGKRDAPSGTAGRILEVLEGAGEYGERVHGRVGEAPRTTDEIGVHAVRAGTVTGEHTVLLAGNHEELRLTHRAEDRRVFAAGALDAATWIADRPAGQYGFEEVLAT